MSSGTFPIQISCCLKKNRKYLIANICQIFVNFFFFNQVSLKIKKITEIDITIIILIKDSNQIIIGFKCKFFIFNTPILVVIANLDLFSAMCASHTGLITLENKVLNLLFRFVVGIIVKKSNYIETSFSI